MVSRLEINNVIIKRLSIYVLYDPKTKNSDCWKYFGDLVLHDASENKKKKVLGEQVFCCVCLDSAKDASEDLTFGSAKIKAYRKTVSTGNLSRHLQEDHQIDTEKVKGRAKSHVHRISKSTCATAGAGSSTTTRKYTTNMCFLARDLALWFCKSLLPFDSVSDEGMIDFFKEYGIIETDADLPSRDTVGRTGLNDIYESMLSNVKNQILIDKSLQMAITIDLWRDGYRRINYITFTLHYLTCDFELKSFTLKTEIMGGKNTGENIKEAIEDIKKNFALCGKKLFIVTNTEATVKGTVMWANTEIHLCLGYGLQNLITVDGIKKVPEIDALVKKCKKIVKAIRNRLPDLKKEADSQVKKQFFRSLEDASQTIDDDENDPIPDEESDWSSENKDQRSQFGKSATPMRWHSILEMLKSMTHCCCNLNPINNTLQLIDQAELKITQSEWNMLEDLIKFLSKFREAVQVLSSQKSGTMNVALLFKSEIKDILNSLSDDDTLIMLSLKNSMLGNVDKRFPTTKATVAAALLDYRFMGLQEVNLYLEAHENIKKRTTGHLTMTRASFLAGYLQEVLGPCETTRDATNNPSTSENKSSSLLLKLAQKHGAYGNNTFQNEDPVEQETWRYLAAADPAELEDGDLLNFWKMKRNTFPSLSALARALLCVPATSIPSESMFCAAGLAIRAKRSRLMPQRLNKIIFVHDNYRLCNINDTDI